ncbi:hypothetical protein AGMMS49975_06680 [Clostridia bacterium]|nr:hypothetical protein AGMMS49975_06680 [Clostridia bacterium]
MKLIENSVRELRISKNISAKELMKLLNLKTKSAYYRKETGEVRFSLAEARKISEFFEMDIDDIFFDNK